MPLHKKSIKLGLWGEAVMIRRLRAMHCGMVPCVLDAVPEQRVIPIDVFRHAGLTRIVDGPDAGAEAAPFAG